MVPYGLYSAYKSALNASWECLVDFRVSELPVKLVPIAHQAGIRVVKNSVAGWLKEGESGITISSYDEWIIVYDDTQIPGRMRYTIAHELGHIFLGHTMVGDPLCRKFDREKPMIERAADMFAERLLAPACVLWGLSAVSADEIMSFCGISRQAARIREARMKILIERGNWLVSPMEREVFRQFKPFIDKYKPHV